MLILHDCLCGVPVSQSRWSRHSHSYTQFHPGHQLRHLTNQESLEVPEPLPRKTTIVRSPSHCAKLAPHIAMNQHWSPVAPAWCVHHALALQSRSSCWHMDWHLRSPRLATALGWDCTCRSLLQQSTWPSCTHQSSSTMECLKPSKLTKEKYLN